MTDAGERPNNGLSGTSKTKDESMSSASHQNAPDSGTTSATSSQSTSSPILKRSSTTPAFSTSASATSSPKASRETSPIRPQIKSGHLPPRPLTRSRKNSQDQDKSPVRGASVGGSSIPTIPSAAAIQRALSAAGSPNLPSSSAQQDTVADAHKAQKPSKPAAGPTSKPAQRIPRLSSPPPAASSGASKSVLNTGRKLEQSQSTPSTPSIVVERHSLVPKPAVDEAAGEEEPPPRSGMRTPTRGASGSGAPLETVQESSPSAGSVLNSGRPIEKSKSSASDRPSRIDEDPSEEEHAQGVRSRAESENESSGSKNIEAKNGDGWKPVNAATPAKAPTIHSKKSYTQLPSKLKSASDGSIKNMTVETETVSSIPQVAVGGGAGERGAPARSDTGGSIRLKPSTETIRPKKEKKKVVRKAPSVNAGTGGSLSRLFFSHHRLHSRLPHPGNTTASSTESSTLCNDEYTEDDEVSPLQSTWPGDSSLKVQSPRDALFSANPCGPLRRFSSGLMKFSGRTASSKADVFEAKVASAVGEADSSDSEETFVYESNPPEPPSARAHRFHSRTPSTASTLSQLDHAKVRQDNPKDVVKKKSMKFATNYSTINYPNDGEGTVRGPSQTGRGSGTPHHHHIGRFGRGGHASIFDKDSPFANPSKSPRSGNARFQQVTSPRHSRRQSPGASRLSGSARKAEEALSYDLEGEGADDERTPLTRNGRNRRRALPGSVRQMYLTEDRENRYCGRVTAFTSLGTVLALLIAAIVIILVLCTKPLYEVHVQSIQNVLASESEIMLDLHVRAINPNIIAIQVSDLDVNLFAKSRHVGTASAQRRKTLGRSFFTRSSSSPGIVTNSQHRSSLLQSPKDIVDQLDGIDEGTDPIGDDPASDSQTMLLGRILTFDSPLIFDASPLHRKVQIAVGEVRVNKPGNRTEEGGSARWERVLQHDFELIVRGVVQYTLPISSKARSASISGKVIVHPSEEDSDGTGGMRLSLPKDHEDDGSNVIIIPPEQAIPDSGRRRIGPRIGDYGY